MFTQLLEKLSIPRQMFLLTSIGVLAVCCIIASFRFANLSDTASWAISGLSIAPMILFVVIMGNHVARRTEKIVAALHALAEGDLSYKCAIPGKDEFAWMSWEYSCARKAFSKMVTEILEHSQNLSSAAEELATVTENSKRAVRNQNAQTEQVAAAMTEMSVTIQEIARNASNAAESANNADSEAANGNRIMKDTMNTINSLAQQVERTFVFITKLKQESDGIGAVLDVIRGIAEQTNLLALNAAIEAARAGEQGRGFAVVADEVRTLASRTQESTQEIQDMIQRLQAGANEAVSVMEEGRKRAEISVAQSAKAGESIDSINKVVDNIKDMNIHIATAAEEQSATAEEINQSVVNISNSSSETAASAEQTARATEELAGLATRLQDMVSDFKLAAA
ncbi:MAG: methyl-accepting chemotaxis protein [Methylococcaceae bacterium]|nr:methyl-accepting chemotaxis protein [Methylococcaceae bacterium]